MINYEKNIKVHNKSASFSVKKIFMNTKQISILGKHASWVAAGNVVSKIIMFAANIWIANHLLDQGYGAVSFAFVIVNYFYLLAFSGIETVATRESAKISPSKLGEFTAQLILIRSILVIAIFVITWATGNLIGGLTGLMVKLYALSLIPQIFNVINLFYGVEWSWPITIYFIGGRVLYFGILILTVKNIEDAKWAPIAFGIAIASENLFLFILWLRKIKFGFLKKLSKFDYKKWTPAIPISLAVGGLLLHENFAGIFIKFTDTEAALSIYYAAFRLVFVVISLTLLLSYVFLARFVKFLKENPKSALKFFRQICLLGIISGAVFALSVSLLSTHIIKIIYKPELFGSAGILAIAAWQMCIAPARVISFQALNACHKQNKTVFLIFIGTALSICAIIFIGKFYGMKGAVIGTVIGELILAAILYLAADKELTKKT